MGPIEVGENNGGKVERHERENAYPRKEEKKVAVSNHHCEPVGARKLVDQHTRGSNKRCTEHQETNSHEDASTGHWLSPVFSQVHNAILPQNLPGQWKPVVHRPARASGLARHWLLLRRNQETGVSLVSPHRRARPRGGRGQGGRSPWRNS